MLDQAVSEVSVHEFLSAHWLVTYSDSSKVLQLIGLHSPPWALVSGHMAPMPASFALQRTVEGLEVKLPQTPTGENMPYCANCLIPLDDMMEPGGHVNVRETGGSSRKSVTFLHMT